MTWFKLDDQSTFHAKVVAAGNEAWGAFCRAGAWSSAQLTDGKIPWRIALMIGPRRLWNHLISVGLCEILDDENIQLHDFLVYNPTAEAVRAERARKAKNVADFRARRRQDETNDVTEPVTGNVTGNVTGVVTGLKSRPVPSRPDPDPKEEREREAPDGAGSHSGGSSNGAETGRGQPKRPASLKTPLPDPFEPGERAFAAKKLRELTDEQADLALAKFVEHYRNATSDDWDGKFAKWLLNERTPEAEAREPRSRDRRRADAVESEVDREHRKANGTPPCEPWYAAMGTTPAPEPPMPIEEHAANWERVRASLNGIGNMNHARRPPPTVDYEADAKRLAKIAGPPITDEQREAARAQLFGKGGT